jgi:hypothetical protein
MERHPEWGRAGRPQAEHRPAGAADPEEGGTEAGILQCDAQPDDVAVERDRAVEVGDGEMALEEPVDAHRLVHAAISR